LPRDDHGRVAADCVAYAHGKVRLAIPLPGGIAEAVRKLLYSHLILADSAPAMAIEEWK